MHHQQAEKIRRSDIGDSRQALYFQALLTGLGLVPWWISRYGLPGPALFFVVASWTALPLACAWRSREHPISGLRAGVVVTFFNLLISIFTLSPFRVLTEAVILFYVYTGYRIVRPHPDGQLSTTEALPKGEKRESFSSQL